MMLPDFEALRDLMVVSQIVSRGVRDQSVIQAMRLVPRHSFIPEEIISNAYEDTALPISDGQTISQPYIVAAMIEAASLQKNSKVLEIGTGSGYQAAVLSEMGCEVYTIERIPSLAKQAAEVLDSLGYKSISLKTGDGTLGWIEQAPYDAIIVTAAAPDIPKSLVEQLKPSGKIIIPVGDQMIQRLKCVTKSGSEDVLGAVRFVPLIGAEGF